MTIDLELVWIAPAPNCRERADGALFVLVSASFALLKNNEIVG